MALETTPPTPSLEVEDPSSSSNSGVSIYIYTRLLHKRERWKAPKDSAWYLITPTSKSGEILPRLFAGLPPPEDGFEIHSPGLAVVGHKLYLIGGCCRYWSRANCAPYYSAIRCLDTRADPLEWKTISHLPQGYKIARTAVSAPWIYVFGYGDRAYNGPLMPRPWGYAINIDNPEKTFLLPAPYPHAPIPEMCTVLEEGLLFHIYGDGTLRLLNLKDLSFSLHSQMPAEVIPKAMDYVACMYSSGVFYRCDMGGTIYAYDTVCCVHLPSRMMPPEMFEWLEHSVAVLYMFPASDGKIGLFIYYDFMCVAYVEISVTYNDDSTEMLVHSKRKLYLQGDELYEIFPCYPCGDQVGRVDEERKEKSIKDNYKKKKKRGKKKEFCNIHNTHWMA